MVRKLRNHIESKAASGTQQRFHQSSTIEGTRLAEKREQILAGALRAFLSQGYIVSMDAIANESGVAKQTIYSYFKDKQSLFGALMDRLLDRFVSAGMNEELMSLEPQVLLRKLAQITLSRMDDWEYVSLLRLVIGESARFPELGDLYLSRLVQPATQRLAEYFRSCDKLYFADPEATARIVHGSLIHFMVVQEILGGKHSMPLARDRAIGSLVDMILFASEHGRQAR